MKYAKHSEELTSSNVCGSGYTKEIISKRNLKLFAIFLAVVMILVTVYILVKREKDIERGTTPSNIPNQANISK